MGNWQDLYHRITKAHQDAQGIFDTLRRDAIRKLHKLSGRNVIVYYSGWLQKPDLRARYLIHDGDKNGFMASLHKLDFAKGLDLVLHTPGGEMAATESLVEYLHSKFSDIRVIVPQIAMSAGTMIACASNRILMGDPSSLGPIDPQINGLPAHGILSEFRQAAQEIAQEPTRIAVWQPIIAKYHPTLIGECQKAMQMAEEMVKTWLEQRMFAGDPQASTKAARVVTDLGDHDLTKSHARHISKAKAIALGLNIESLEANDDLQDAVMTIHHACIHTLSSTEAVKIIENHQGMAYIERYLVPTPR